MLPVILCVVLTRSAWLCIFLCMTQAGGLSFWVNRNHLPCFAITLQRAFKDQEVKGGVILYIVRERE